jgi:hypothetical protein
MTYVRPPNKNTNIRLSPYYNNGLGQIKRSLAETKAQPLGDLQALEKSIRNVMYVGVGGMALFTLLYLWSTSPKARREYLGRRAQRWAVANPGKKYYVKTKAATERGRRLPGWIRGPYSLKSAKDYARIGSQFGRDRLVIRGRGGPAVRRYSDGKRA